jgi:hypothetical protein
MDDGEKFRASGLTQAQWFANMEREPAFDTDVHDAECVHCKSTDVVLIPAPETSRLKHRVQCTQCGKEGPAMPGPKYIDERDLVRYGRTF